MYGLTALLLSSTIAGAPAPSDDPAPLITRNHAQLHLAGAQRILDGAMARAKELKLNVNVSVVDDGGHLLAFARMDGARPASV